MPANTAFLRLVCIPHFPSTTCVTPVDGYLSLVIGRSSISPPFNYAAT